MINPNQPCPSIKKGLKTAGVFNGGTQQIVTTNAFGETQVSKGQQLPFKSSESQTQNFVDYTKEKRQQQRNQNPPIGGLY